MESFLQVYTDFRERTSLEKERLRHSANWMDLILHVMQPRNNKTYLLALIPRIVEGKNARYITGSGQTKATSDRVEIFRIEGQCEKIRRPPRKKKEVVTPDLPSLPSLQHFNQLPLYPMSRTTLNGVRFIFYVYRLPTKCFIRKQLYFPLVSVNRKGYRTTFLSTHSNNRVNFSQPCMIFQAI